MGVFTKKKLNFSKLEYCSLFAKVNFSVIHFLKSNDWVKGFVNYRKSYILTVKNNDKWIFLILFFFPIVLLWRLDLRLTLHQHRWAVAGHEFCSK